MNPRVLPWPIGHDVTKYWQNQPDDHAEETWWIGKPWRRLELMNTHTFWNNECVDTTRQFSASLGLRRLGLHFHVSFTRQQGYDYSEEPNP